MMKVDIRQIEEASARMRRMEKELQEIRDTIDDVIRDLDRQQIGSAWTTMQFTFALRSDRIELMNREVGLMTLAMALENAARAYESCEQKAMKHSESNFWRGGFVNPIFYQKTDCVPPVSIIDSIERYIVPLMGQEGR